MSLVPYRPLHESGYGRLGLKFSKKSGKRTLPNPRPKPLDLGAIARGQVLPAYKSQRNAVLKLIENTQADAKDRANYMRFVYDSLAKYMQGVGPKVHDIYAEAGNRTAGYAAGYAAGLKLQEQGSAQNVNDVLKLIGAPEGQAPQNYNAADRLYALTGYLPAASLAQTGAGWESYAATLPGNYAQRGIADIAASLKDSSKDVRDLRAELLKIGANESADVLKQLNALRSRRDQRSQFNAQMREKQREFNRELAYRTAIARAQNLISGTNAATSRGNLLLAQRRLQEQIAQENRRIKIAQQNADTSALNASTRRIEALNRTLTAVRTALSGFGKGSTKKSSKKSSGYPGVTK